MEDFIFGIKYSESSDVINLFKTLDINESNSLYIYSCMSNPFMYSFIKDIIEPYLKNKIIEPTFNHIIDGWMDCWMHKKDNIKEKNIIKDIIISIIRTDKISLEKNDNTINYLYKEFNINYYAEIMMG